MCAITIEAVMKLDKYVTYMGTKNGQILYSSIDACFNHNPPTFTDIKEMQEIIKNKFNLDSCLILGWQDITPAEELIEVLI